MSVIYHVLSRGVDKRKIFMDDEDRLRFIHDLYEFNDRESSLNVWYSFKNSKKQYSDLRGHYIEKEKKKRKFLVKVLAFCLMPNHYHLLLAPEVEMGITKFMMKLNVGYAKYFNEKYKRKGTLFEGRFKSIEVRDEAHFIHLPYYIHLNPLDLAFPEWRERELTNDKKAFHFLENYRWSSFLDYIGKKNFPSITQREFLLEFFDGEEGFKKDIKKWLKELDLESVSDVSLEKE